MNKMNWQTFWTAGGVLLTVVTLLVGSFAVTNASIHKLNDKMDVAFAALNNKIDDKFNLLNTEIQGIKERLTVIETTLILKGIMNRELATQETPVLQVYIP